MDVFLFCIGWGGRVADQSRKHVPATPSQNDLPFAHSMVHILPSSSVRRDTTYHIVALSAHSHSQIFCSDHNRHQNHHQRHNHVVRFSFIFLLLFLTLFLLSAPKLKSCESFHLCMAHCSQDHKHSANDADELERYGLLKKSKARVAKHDYQSKAHHHETLGSKLKQVLELKAKDHDSKHDKTVASLLTLLDDVDSKLHDECVITVREEPNLHIVFYKRGVPDGMRTPWKLLCFVKRSGE